MTVMSNTETTKLTELVAQMMGALIEKRDFDVHFVVIVLDKDGPQASSGEKFVASTVASSLGGDSVPFVLRKVADSIEAEGTETQQ